MEARGDSSGLDFTSIDSVVPIQEYSRSRDSSQVPFITRVHRKPGERMDWTKGAQNSIDRRQQSTGTPAVQINILV
jgi:hypothetical protein